MSLACRAQSLQKHVNNNSAITKQDFCSFNHYLSDVCFLHNEARNATAVGTMRERDLSLGPGIHMLHLLDQWGHWERKATVNEKFRTISISDRGKPFDRPDMWLDKQTDR